jgi:predicted glycosyltransferase
MNPPAERIKLFGVPIDNLTLAETVGRVEQLIQQGGVHHRARQRARHGAEVSTVRIWFDLSNSPHINLFARMIRDLEGEGHEVVITCRPLANTIDLLDLHRFRYEVVGLHYGGKLSMKLLGYPVRVWQLYRYLKPQRINVAISQSSFHSPLASRMLGVRSIYMNDNEHAIGNIPSFLFADRIMVPEFLSAEKLRKQWANPKKVLNYPGVKEGIYLWELDERLRSSSAGRAPKPRPSIYVRPEPWAAQYYKGEVNFMDQLLLGIKDKVDVTVLPRGKVQGAHYRDARFNGVRVVDTAMDIADIAPDCDLFVGAGGTMTREMAVLGIPTISVYQDELLDVDRYLLEVGAFVHAPQLRPAELLEFLDGASRRSAYRHLLDKGRQAYAMIKDALLGR